MTDPLQPILDADEQVTPGEWTMHEQYERLAVSNNGKQLAFEVRCRPENGPAICLFMNCRKELIAVAKAAKRMSDLAPQLELDMQTSLGRILLAHYNDLGHTTKALHQRLERLSDD